MPALCQACNERSQCRNICKDLNKEITGKGITAPPKKRTYTVDYAYIEDTHNALNSFQREILECLRNITLDIEAQWIKELTLNKVKEAIKKNLNSQKKLIIDLTLEGYTREEVADVLGISHPRVCQLLKKGIETIKHILGLTKNPETLNYQRRE